MTVPVLDPEQAAALDTARALAAAGIPVFVAPADPTNATGYALPRNWQKIGPDPAVVDGWRPGMAIAAVTGHGLDVVDVDPRNGGDPASLNGKTPTSYGAAFTPSGGVHSFIRSLGVRKRTNVVPGIDVQAGAPDGSGRGFVFLAPTVRTSKVTGEPVAYRWVTFPDLRRLASVGESDVSGFALAELIRGGSSHTDAANVSPDEFMRTGPWANIEATLAAGRNDGVARLAQALRGRGGWRVDDVLRYMRSEVWPRVDQTQGGHEFTLDEFETTVRAQWRQYNDGQSELVEPAQAENAHIDRNAMSPPNLDRYFTEKNSLQAATLATDVMGLGPLARGVDNYTWSYHGGVWRPARDVVRDRVTFLLGERYRPGHTRNVEDIVGGRVPIIASDPIPDLVNVRNGLLDWRTGQLAEHRADLLSTVQLNVDYDPAATCPAFDRFVGEVVPADVIDTVWELIGYLMFSGNPLHKAVMLTGTGRNGKGTFLRVMVTLLGRHNVTTVSLHDLVNTRFTTASLFGKLANIAGDIDGGYLENTAVLKGITGGDMISAEHKGRDRFDFAPWAVPVFSANRVPSSADTTVGYLSRWLVVNFPNDFTGRENRHLDDELRTPGELAGIAVKGLAALPRLLARGDFPLTESAAAAREEFVRRVDQVRTWLYDCAVLDPDAPWLARTELYQAYQRWAARDGHRPVKASEFYDRLETAGAVPATIHGTRGFRGIRITDQGHPFTFGAPSAPNLPTSTQGAATPGTDLHPTTGQQTSKSEAGQGAEGAETPYPHMRAGAGAHVYARAYAHEGGYQGAAPPAPNDPPLTSAPDRPKRGPRPRGADQRAADAARRRELAAAEPATVDDRPHSRRITDRILGIDAPTVEPPRQDPPPDPRAAKAAAKTAERAAAREAERQAKVAEAGGPPVPLPALATRDGRVTTVPLAAVDELAGAFGWTAELTVDVETSGYPVGHPDYALRTIQVGGEHAALVLDAADRDQAAAAARLLAAARVLHAHSATAELVPLAVADLVDHDDAWARMHDTVIPAKLADPASTGSDPGLKQIAAAMLGQAATAPGADAARAELFKAGRWLTEVKATTPVEKSGWAQVDSTSTTMVRYAASDVLDDAAIAARLPAVAPALLERERTAQIMTARVAHRGLRLDADHVDTKLPEHRAALQAAAVRLADFGIDNPGSDQQVAARLLELGAPLPRTKTGRPSVAKGALDPFAAAEGPIGELIRARLDYQHHETVIGLFLEPYAQLVHRGDGRARPTVYTLAADTGRMSCVRPNCQQVPREGGMRACITADPGALLVSADFAGVELRVAAALSGDRNLQRMLADGVDVHWEIARLAFGPDATKADRYAVKRGVFGRIYGGGVAAIARGVGVSETVAAAIIDALDAMLPELAQWSNNVRDAVRAGATRFETYSGRVVHLPQAFPHKAPNYCIQGTARELLVDTLVRWRDTAWGSCTLLPVHDEIVLVVPEDEAADATAALAAAMETELHGVPIKAEASTPSFAWQDAS